MASKMTAVTNSSRGGVHHFLRATYFEHQSRVYRPYNHIRQPLGGSNMALSSILHIAGPWQGWRHNACVQCTSGRPRTPISGSLQECKGSVTQTSKLTECLSAENHNSQLVKSCDVKCITCPACQGTPGPSDPVARSQTSLSLPRELWCYTMSRGNRNVTALLAGCK